VRGRRVRGRCFVTDGARLILPALGAYTGGLDVHDPAIASLMRDPFRVLLLGRSKLYDFPSTRLRGAPVAAK
jgi:metallophosphoesterase superfamily enzyme